MTKNTQNQTTWSQLAKTILAKSGDDYQTKVQPNPQVRSEQTRMVIERLGRKRASDKPGWFSPLNSTYGLNH